MRNFIKIIHIAKSQLKLDDETYRDILKDKFNVTSSKELSRIQANELIYFFKQKGFKFKRKKQIKNNDMIKLATVCQYKLIDVLKRNIVWRVSFDLWLNKRMNIKKIVSTDDARKVIEGLKAMLKITAKHIEFRALPFPYNDLNIFNNKWVYDLNKNKLIFIDDGSAVKILE